MQTDFASRISPRAACPAAVLTVIGKNPPVGLEGSAVDVTGYVPDLAPYMAETGVFLVPLHAGGGMRVGQVIGSTDRLGGEAADRPVSFQEVFATLYHNLGVDLDSQRLFDFRGRPQYLVDSGVKPIAELIA